MRSDESYPADWLIPYPSTCDISTTWRILNSTLICGWSWDHFIWNLEELHRLLSERPAEFNYLYVTRFLTARAAYLAMTGPFSSCQVTVLDGIARHKLQFAAIYRFLFMFGLEHALAQRDEAPGLGLNDGRLFRVDIGMIETTYLEILEVIGLMPDADMIAHGYRVGDWAEGILRVAGKPPLALAPAAVPVPVDIEEMGRYRKVKPSPTEMAIKILARDRIRCFREHDGDATVCDRELDRLCTWEKVGGYPVIRCGDEFIEYYVTTISGDDTILSVVCADRTILMMQAGVSRPGSRPKQIFLGWPSDARDSCSLDSEVDYLVEFDNGTSDVFRLSFRAHHESEKQDVPPCLRGKAGRRAEGGKRRAEMVEPLSGKKGDRAEDDGERRVKASPLPARPADTADEEDRSEEEDNRAIAAAVVKLATTLDMNPRMKPPTHAAVLRLYCIEGLSIQEIEKRVKCSHGTVMNRKRRLERDLGPLEQFKDMGSLIADMERAVNDPRAKEIFRRSLLE